MTCSCHPEKYEDPHGNTWLPPTAEAYALTCMALAKANADLERSKNWVELVAAEERIASLQAFVDLAIAVRECEIAVGHCSEANMAATTKAAHEARKSYRAAVEEMMRARHKP